MTKHFCWICNKEIFLLEERQKRNLMAGVQVEEICVQCEKKLGNLIEQLKENN